MAFDDVVEVEFVVAIVEIETVVGIVETLKAVLQFLHGRCTSSSCFDVREVQNLEMMMTRANLHDLVVVVVVGSCCSCSSSS